MVSDGAGESSALTLKVVDPIEALGQMAAAHRRRLRAKVIAVTGSNGKTTTKGMIDRVLGSRWRGRAAVKSFNNQLGVRGWGDENRALPCELCCGVCELGSRNV